MELKNKLTLLAGACGAFGAMFGTFAGSSQVWINVLVGGGMGVLVYYFLTGFLKE